MGCLMLRAPVGGHVEQESLIPSIGDVLAMEAQKRVLSVHPHPNEGGDALVARLQSLPETFIV